MMQSDQLTTKIPNYLHNNIGIGQQNDNDYQDDREYYLCGIMWNTRHSGCTVATLLISFYGHFGHI